MIDHFIVKVTFIKSCMSDEENLEPARMCLRQHGRDILQALVFGIVGDAPRSVVPNLATVLATLTAKLPSESREWLHHSMMSVCHAGVIFENGYPSLCYIGTSDQ